LDKISAVSGRSTVLALGVAVLTGAAWASTETIGGWVLRCSGDTPGTEACLLHSDKRLLDTAGITGDLEIQAQGKLLVPVVVVRGLSGEIMRAASLAGETEVSIRFGDGAPEDLSCSSTGGAYVCAPKDDAARRLAAALPAARSVTVHASIAIAGSRKLPVGDNSLDLTSTNEALSRLRAAGPSQVPGPMTELASPSPSTLLGIADRALKAAGYPNGAADLKALVTKYIKK
jgi:hypothetical protein